MNHQAVKHDFGGSQSGGGMLTVVAVLGLLLMLVQGTVYYRSKAGAKFLGSEKNKVLAMQMAEAGVEENIADLAKRMTKVRAGLTDSTTYDHKTLEGGQYTSRLSTVGIGATADTVDLTSTGSVNKGSHTIQARLRLKKYIDTTKTPIMTVTPETTMAFGSHMAPKPDSTLTVTTPASLPAVHLTPAYAACMASPATKCDVCHMLGGNPATRVVLNVLKANIKPSHQTHIGDYVTTDGTCDLYTPHFTYTFTMVSVPDTTLTIVDKTTYDTTVVIDTAVKVQILSWK
ncbi:MAG TPA: hypothetical protein VJ385_17780 [Fibrobacteria bacterium]|nr:hypothetical protein [Fibrobacteria bacterium]